MYRWRQLTDEQRQQVLADRKAGKKPWHSPPHYESDETNCYLITAACFEHQPIIGQSPGRMAEFELELVRCLLAESRKLFAWTVLPNHYHGLVDTRGIRLLITAIGKLHGRTSHRWNGEEKCRGRQVWCRVAETAMKSSSHYYASVNYVLHNAVRHGYVRRWTDWPYCNARDYLETTGRERALEIWRDYPLFDYGKDWDPPEL